MLDVDKEKVRPIYTELQGYLSKAPKDAPYVDTYSSALSDQVNHTIEELGRVTGKNYSRFKIQHIHMVDEEGGGYRIETVVYLTKLSGLVSRLHGEYFSDEKPPFSGMPSTIISQSQQQSQSFQLELLQIQSKIDEQIPKLEQDDKKRKFLEKVKGALSTVRDVAGLIALLLKTGQEFGLTIDELKGLF